MLRYSLRLHRWGMIGFGFVVFVATYAQGSAYGQLAGPTAASRARFAQEMTLLGTQLSYILPIPRHVDSLASYVQWRAWGTLSLLAAIWAIAAAATSVRGDEDKQLVDRWLATGLSRTRLVGWRIGAFTLAAAIVAILAGLGTLAGAAAGRGALPAAGLLGQMMALWLFSAALFAIGVLVAQVPRSLRAAQAAAAAVVLALYAVNALARTQHAFDGAAWLSPFHWYEATDSLAFGGSFDIRGALLCAGTVPAALALAAFAFSRRDLRGGLFSLRAPGARPSAGRPSELLRFPVARLLHRQRWIVLTWGLAVAGLGVFMVAIAHGTVEIMLALPALRQFVARGGADPYAGYLTIVWFNVAQLLIAGLALHLVSRWVADDNEGVLAAILSRPVRRWEVVAERAAEAALVLLVVAALGGLVVYAAAAGYGIRLSVAAASRASAMLVPFGLTFAAAGAAGAARWPRAVVGVLGVVAGLSYLLYELAPLMAWPAWVADLSVFTLYATPANEIFWGGLWAMAAIVAAGFGGAAYAMQRRELTG